MQSHIYLSKENVIYLSQYIKIKILFRYNTAKIMRFSVIILRQNSCFLILIKLKILQIYIIIIIYVLENTLIN